MRHEPPAVGMTGFDSAARRFLEGVFAHCHVTHGQSIDWACGVRLRDGTPVQWPADLCVRRPENERDFTPPLKLGTGCGAGSSATDATLHALFELVERDAAGLWWQGGMRGRPVGSVVARQSMQVLERLRRGASGRDTWLLDITTNLEIPSVAAISARTDGYGFAYGLGCRQTLADASFVASLELCQMELGQRLVAAKQKEADAVLNDGDLGHLRRAGQVDRSTCSLLHPIGSSRSTDHQEFADPGELLRSLIQRLTSRGIETFAFDLSRPELGIPVVRVVAPALQLAPCSVITSRLSAAMAATGGGGEHTGGVALF